MPRTRLLKALVAFVLFVIVLSVIKLAEEQIHKTLPGYSAYIAGVVIAYIGEHLIGDRVLAWVERWIDKDQHLKLKQLERLVESIPHHRNIDDVAQYLDAALTAILRPRRCALYVAEASRYATCGPRSASSIAADSPLVAHLHDVGERVVFARADDNRRQFCCFPLRRGSEIVGLLLAETPYPDRFDREAFEIEVRAIVKVCRSAEAKVGEFIDYRALKRSEELAVLARAAAARIAAWVEARFREMTAVAGRPEMALNNGTAQRPALEALRLTLGNDFNGVYSLDEYGRVLKHLAPPLVRLEGTNWRATGREYFIRCLDNPAPLVSNWMRSSDRLIGIIVFVMPRYDAHGRFIGIVDAVMDHPFPPFSRILAEVLREGEPTRADNGDQRRSRLMLIDEENMVLGTSRPTFREASSLDSDLTVTGLLSALSVESDAMIIDGAIARVAGTPFKVVALRAPLSGERA